MDQSLLTPASPEWLPPATRSRVARLLRSRVFWLMAAMLLVAVVTRFWALGDRALHHDESLHAYYSWEFYEKGSYQHDPLMHGPLLFHLTALGYWLFGDSDFTSRLVPALLGVLLVGLPWKFRDWLGTRGALVASLLLLVSPTVLYYSRFIREDIFAAVWTVIIVYGMWAYLARGERVHLYINIAGWALLFSQKEISFMLALLFWLFLALVVIVEWRRGLPIRESRAWHLLVTLGAILLPLTSAAILHLAKLDPAGGYNGATYRNIEFLQTAGGLTVALLVVGLVAGLFLWERRGVLTSALIFYTIFVLLHTTMLTWPWGIGSGMVGSLGYWIEQHGVERGGQPWYYYLMLLPLYEFLPLLIAFGFGAERLIEQVQAWRAAPRGESAMADARSLWPWFLLWWFATFTFALSFAGEKMPWLLLHLAVPLIFLAGWAADRTLARVNGAALLTRYGLLAVAIGGLAWMALGTLAWLIIGSDWPLRSNDLAGLTVTGRWLAALLMLVLFIWVRPALERRLSIETVTRATQLALLLLLLFMTARFAYIASFRNGDTPNEPLIYTQTSPQVPMVMREIEQISRMTTGGLDLKVAHDNDTLWPFIWYLRHYPNRLYYGNSPASQAEAIREAPVVLVSLSQVDALLPYVTGYIRHDYSMRPNFPEDYKRIIPRGLNAQGVEGEQAWNVIRLLDNVAKAAAPDQARRDFRDFFWNRRVNYLGRFDFVVFVKPEIAAEVWPYALQVATIDPALLQNPYTEKIQTLTATGSLGAGSLSQPKAVTVLPDGRVAAVDTVQHRIVLFNPDGSIASSFGGMGQMPGQFNEPWGIAAAPDGTLYVADTWNSRIQHLTAEGEVLHVWGAFTDTGGQLGTPSVFWGPRGVAVAADGRVWVTDTGNARVQLFEADGTFVAQYGGKGIAPGQFSEPVGIAVAPDGTIWVADTWNQRVQGFTPDFQPLVQFPVRAWAGQNITNKPSIAASDDRIWISDPEMNRLLEFDREGEIQRLWGHFGSDLTSLNLPLGLALDGEGGLWVADNTNNRLVRFEVE